MPLACAALRHQEAEGDHLALRERQAGAGVVIAKAVRRQPAVDVALLPRLEHLRSEDLCLRLRALLEPVVHRGGGLAGQWELDAARGEHVVRRRQERAHAPHSEVVDRLIDDLLHLDRRDALVQRARQRLAEFVDALTAEQRGEDRHVARARVERLPRLVDDLVAGKALISLHKFRIRLMQIHSDSPPVFVSVEVRSSGCPSTRRARPSRRRACFAPSRRPAGAAHRAPRGMRPPHR